MNFYTVYFMANKFDLKFDLTFHKFTPATRLTPTSQSYRVQRDIATMVDLTRSKVGGDLRANNACNIILSS